MSCRFALLAILGTFLFAGSVLADDNIWAGKEIIAKRSGVKVNRTEPDGTSKQIKLKSIVDKVRSEKDGWLGVDNNGEPGWLDKNDVVLIRDAPVYFTDRIRANPKDDEAYGFRGFAWKCKGELEIAIKDLTEAIRLNPSAPGWYNNRGTAYSDKKEYDRAISDYNEAIRLDPKLTNALTNRGKVYYRKKDYNQAIQDYTEAIRLDPRDAAAFDFRGLAYAAKKDFERAIADYAEAIRLAPRNDNVFYNRACYFALLNRTDPAIESLGKSLELGYRNFSHMEKDSDLDSIRSDPRYRELIQKYKK